MFKLSRAYVLTRPSNLTPEWAKNTASDLSVVSLPGTEVAFLYQTAANLLKDTIFDPNAFLRVALISIFD